MVTQSEDSIQAECYRWFNNTFCLKHNNPRLCIFSVPNGGTRNSFEASKLKSTGLKPGVSDVIICLPDGVVKFVEFKNDRGIQSDVQKEFESTVKSLGNEYVLIRSVEQFKKQVNLWLDAEQKQ